MYAWPRLSWSEYPILSDNGNMFMNKHIPSGLNGTRITNFCTNILKSQCSASHSQKTQHKHSLSSVSSGWFLPSLVTQRSRLLSTMALSYPGTSESSGTLEPSAKSSVPASQWVETEGMWRSLYMTQPRCKRPGKCRLANLCVQEEKEIIGGPHSIKWFCHTQVNQSQILKLFFLEFTRKVLWRRHMWKGKSLLKW